MQDFPLDADGDALRRLQKYADFSKPMTIDFQVALPNEDAAKKFAKIVYDLGFRVKVYPSPKCALPWTCECSSRILISYQAVIAIQKELAELSKLFNGFPDGWGSFGNNQPTAK